MLQWLGIAMKWGPHVISAVYLIEQLFGSGLSGPEKKEAVLAWLREKQQKLGLPWGEQVIVVVGSLIDTVVGLLNLLGVFRRTQDLSPDELAAAEAAAAGVNTANVHRVVESDPELAAFLTKTGG
jgi:hypothetical protein